MWLGSVCYSTLVRFDLSVFWHGQGSEVLSFPMSGFDRMVESITVEKTTAKKENRKMKSENILRAARNSLLCFSMALGAGFLVACGGSSDEIAPVAPVAPAAPSALTLSVQSESEILISESEILVTWDAVSGATSYKLYRATVSGGEYAQIGDDLPALTLRYLDTGLSPNTEYFYQLEACNSGGCSRRSAEFSVTTRVSPPVVTVVAQSDSEIEVTWSTVQYATVYKLYRSTVSGGMYDQIGGDRSTLTLAYTDSGLSSGTEHYYQMEACNSGGCSRRLPEVSATTHLSPPVLTVVAQSDSEIDVTWSAVRSATSYKLYRSEGGTTSYSLVPLEISASLSIYMDSGLSTGTKYYYQMEACNSRDECSRRSLAVSGTTRFPVYLSDSAAEGVEYSGLKGDGLTWKGGVFQAGEGEFEFSIGDTTLGRVRLDGDWANAHVTPADFIGVDEQKVIDIARIVQGLDEDGLPRQNGISVSRRARTDVRGDLFDVITAATEISISSVDSTEIDIFSAANRFPSRIYTIPKERDARDHFVDTRKCLFSGVYDGNYRATVFSSGATVSSDPNEQLDDGQIYYAIQPFADPAWATGVKFSNVNPSDNKGIATALSGPAIVGVIGSTITLSEGNELSFITPRVVAGIWQEVTLEGGTDIIVSGTSALTLAEGNPGATRRIVGVDRGGSQRVLGLYVLDYFAKDNEANGGSFSGRYYNIVDNVNYALSLTIVGGGSWSARTTDLILSGTRTASYNGDITATAITVGSITRDGDTHDNDYGTFNARVGIGRTGSETGTILGTWCDISGATGVANPPEPLPRSPAAPRAVATSATRIDVAWDYPIEGASTYNLYRIAAGDPRYLQVLVNKGGIETRGHRDTGLRSGTKYFYQLEVCNTSGCATRSPEASATTFFPPSP